MSFHHLASAGRPARLRTAAALGVAALTLAACAQSVSGTPSAEHATSFPTPTQSAVPVSPAAPVGSGGAGPTGMLEPLPIGAERWTDSWGRTEAPTTAQFVARFYDPAFRVHETTELDAEGLRGIAHRTWIATDGNQIDLILLNFATPSGAAERFTLVSGAAAADSALNEFALTGFTSAQVRGFTDGKTDKDGYVASRAYAHLAGKHVMVEAFYFSPKKVEQADLTLWLAKQLALTT